MSPLFSQTAIISSAVKTIGRTFKTKNHYTNFIEFFNTFSIKL